MLLQLNFSTLLASLFLVLVTLEDAQAAPQSTKRAPNGMITLPLRSVNNARSDVHPHVYLQQHINRSQKRYARMTGRSAPSELELRSNLQKRIDGVRVGHAGASHNKRYVITNKGVNKGIASSAFIDTDGHSFHAKGGGDETASPGSGNGPLAKLKETLAELIRNRRERAQQGAGAINQGSGRGQGQGTDANSTATDPAAEDPSNADPAGGNNSTGTGNNSTGNAQNQGVSPIDIQAAQQGGVTKATGTLADNSIGLDIEANDVGYLAKVQIGTPPRDFELLMDSGSADFWVGAENCQTQGNQQQGAGAGAGAGQGQGQGQGIAQGAKAITRRGRGQGQGQQGQQGQGQGQQSQGQGQGQNGAAGGGNGAAQGNTCGDHQFLGPQSSSSFKASNQPFQVTYGTGNVAGQIVQDDVVLAGLPLKGHTFGVATSESVDFSSDTTSFDGLVGLAQSTLSEQQTLTPVEALAKAGTIKEAITSYKLARLADEKNDGEITFGGLDPAKFDAQTLTTFANVNKQGFWEGAMVPTVNGKSVNLDQGRTAILDTGTTLIIAPPDDASAVHQAIQGAQSDGQGGFTVPCTLQDSVALAFGNQTFNIDPRDLAFLPVDPQDPTGDCISGISSGQIGGATEWLVGGVFLKNAYFSHDVTANTVSLAKLV